MQHKFHSHKPWLDNNYEYPSYKIFYTLRIVIAFSFEMKIHATLNLHVQRAF